MRAIQAQIISRTEVAGRFGRIIRPVRLLGIIWFAMLLPGLAPPCGAALPSTNSVKLAWNRSPSPEVTGYRIYYGAVSRSYSNSITLGNVTNNTVSGLTSGDTHYFAVAAYTASGLESPCSNELLYVVPGGLVQLQIRLTANQQAIITVIGQVGHTYEIQAAVDVKTWTILDTVTTGASGSVSYTNTHPGNFSKRFYRARDTQP